MMTPNKFPNDQPNNTAMSETTENSRTVTLRLPASLAKYLADNYKNINQGAIDCISAARDIRAQSLAEVSSILTEEEIQLVQGRLKEIRVSGSMRCNPQAMAAHIANTCTATANKIGTLTAAQTDALYFLSDRSNKSLEE